MPEDDFNLVFRQGSEPDSIKMRLDEVYRPELIPETPSVSKVTLVDAFPPDLFPYDDRQKAYSLSEIQFYNNGQFGGGQTTRIEAPEHVGMMIADHLNALKVEPEFFPETVKAVTDGIVDGTPELADPQVAREVADTNFPLFMLALPSHLRASSPTELIMGPFRDVIEPYMIA